MSRTSWQVKKRYNEKVYSRIEFQLEKELVKDFRDKCKKNGISQASVIREAMKKFLSEG